MRCALCKKESNIIYVMSKQGCICAECAHKINDSDDAKIRQAKEKLKMYKKYGRKVDGLPEKTE